MAYLAFAGSIAVIALLGLLFSVEGVFFVRDPVTERIRRPHEPRVEQETRQRLLEGRLSVARPVTPGVVSLDDQDYQSPDCELHLMNRGRSLVLVVGMAVIVLCVYGVLAGWDVSGLTGLLSATNRVWNTRSILEEQVIFAIRLLSRPWCEYGRTKFRIVAGRTPGKNKRCFYFYVLAETSPSITLRVRRRTYITAREQRHPSPDDSVLDPLYEVGPGCEDAFASLSPHTHAPESLAGVT